MRLGCEWHLWYRQRIAHRNPAKGRNPGLGWLWIRQATDSEKKQTPGIAPRVAAFGAFALRKNRHVWSLKQDASTGPTWIQTLVAEYRASKPPRQHSVQWHHSSHNLLLCRRSCPSSLRERRWLEDTPFCCMFSIHHNLIQTESPYCLARAAVTISSTSISVLKNTKQVHHDGKNMLLRNPVHGLSATRLHSVATLHQGFQVCQGNAHCSTISAMCCNHSSQFTRIFANLHLLRARYMHSGQIMIFHQPGFFWNNCISGNIWGRRHAEWRWMRWMSLEGSTPVFEWSAAPSSRRLVKLEFPHCSMELVTSRVVICFVKVKAVGTGTAIGKTCCSFSCFGRCCTHREKKSIVWSFHPKRREVIKEIQGIVRISLTSNNATATLVFPMLDKVRCVSIQTLALAKCTAPQQALHAGNNEKFNTLLLRKGQ